MDAYRSQCLCSVQHKTLGLQLSTLQALHKNGYVNPSVPDHICYPLLWQPGQQSSQLWQVRQAAYIVPFISTFHVFPLHSFYPSIPSSAPRSRHSSILCFSYQFLTVRTEVTDSVRCNTDALNQDRIHYRRPSRLQRKLKSGMEQTLTEKATALLKGEAESWNFDWKDPLDCSCRGEA